MSTTERTNPREAQRRKYDTKIKWALKEQTVRRIHLLECDAVTMGKWFQTFGRNVVPLPLSSRVKQSKKFF